MVETQSRLVGFVFLPGGVCFGSGTVVRRSIFRRPLQPLPFGRGVAARSKCIAMQGNAVFYAGKQCFLRKKTLFSLWYARHRRSRDARIYI